MFRVLSHRLNQSTATPPEFPIHHFQTPNITAQRYTMPKLIIMHYTAGLTASSTVDWCLSLDSAVSYHLIIGRDGQVYQLADFNRRTWHAGISEWGEIRDINGCSIGIALANMGTLPQYPSQDEVPAIPRMPLCHKFTPNKIQHWEPYTEAQYRSLDHVLTALFTEYDIQAILGHDDVAPTRKIDPGPAFPPLPILEPKKNSHILYPSWNNTIPTYTPTVNPKPNTYPKLRLFACNDCNIYPCYFAIPHFMEIAKITWPLCFCAFEPTKANWQECDLDQQTQQTLLRIKL